MIPQTQPTMSSAQTITTTLTTITSLHPNLNPIQQSPLPQIITKSYTFLTKDIISEFRDSYISAQQIGDQIRLQVFYPRDVTDLKREVEKLREILKQSENKVSADGTGLNTIRKIKTVFQTEQKYGKSTSEVQSFKDPSLISFNIQEFSTVNSPFSQLQTKYLLQEKEFSTTITNLHQKIQYLTNQTIKLKVQNQTLFSNNNKLLEEVINLEARLLTLSQQFHRTERKGMIIVNEIREERMQEESEDETIKQLRVNVKRYMEKNYDLVQEMGGLRKENQYLQTNNQILMNEILTLQQRSHSHPISIDQQIIVNQIIEHDVMVQTDLLSSQISLFLHQSNNVKVIQTEYHSDLILIKELQQKEVQMEKELKKRDRQIMQFTKQKEEWMSKIKSQKKIIEGIKKEKKGLEREVSVEEIVEEIEIVEYDVEIQTEITMLNFPSESKISSKQSSLLVPPTNNSRKNSNRSRQNSEIRSTQDNICQKQLKKTINRLKDQLNKSQSKNKSLIKQLDGLQLKMKQQKKTITELRSKNKTLLKLSNESEIKENNLKMEDNEQVVVSYIVEYDVEIQTEITCLRQKGENVFSYVDMTKSNECFAVCMQRSEENQKVITAVESIKYINVPVIKEIEVLGPERIVEVEKIVQIVVEKIVEKPVEIVIQKVVQKIVEKPIQIIKQVIIQKPIQVIKQIFIQKIIQKPIQIIKQHPIYIDKIIQKQVIKYINHNNLQIPPPTNSHQYQQFLKFKSEYLKLKDLFDKVYADNLVLIDLHNESKQDYKVIQEGKKMIQKHEQTINGLEVNVKVLDGTVRSLEGKVKSLESSNKTLENNNRTLEGSNRMLDNNIKVMKVEISNITQSSSNSAKNHDSMINKYILELDSLKKINSQSSGTIKKLTDEKHVLQIKSESQIKSLKQVNQLMKSDVIGIQRELKKITQQNQSYLSKIQTFNLQIKQYQLKQQTLSTQNDNAHRTNLLTIQTLQKQLQEIQGREQTLLRQLENLQKSTTNKILSQEIELLQLKTKEQGLLAQNSTLQRENSANQTEIQRLLALEAKVSSNYQASLEEIKLLRSYIEGVNKTSDENVKLGIIQESIQVTHLKSEISRKQRDILQVQNDNNRLATELKILREQFQNSKKPSQTKKPTFDKSTTTFWIQNQLSQTIQQLTLQLTNTNTQLLSLQSKLSLQQQRNISLSNQLRSLTNDSNTHTKSTSKLHSLTQTIQQYKQEIYQKDIEYHKLKSQFLKSNEIIVKLNGEKDRLSNDVFAFQKEQKEMKMELYNLNLLRIELQQVSASRTEKEGMTNDEKYNKLSQQYRKASERIYQLTLQLDQERIANSKLRSENQVASIQIQQLGSDSRVKHILTGEGLVSKEQYLKVLTDLKASEDVIVNLKGIISEYQQLIDEQNEGRDDELDRSEESEKMYESILKEKIEEYESLIKSKIEYIDQIALKTQERQGLGSDANIVIDKLMKKLKREKVKRQSLQDRLLKLGGSLADYQKQIIQKTQKISYLNYLLLNLQQKSQLNQTIQDQSLSQIERDERSEESSGANYYKDSYKSHFGQQEYRYKKYTKGGKYQSSSKDYIGNDRFIRSNRNHHMLPEEFEGEYERKRIEDNINHDMLHEEYYGKISTPQKSEKHQPTEQCISLRTLINDPEDFTPLSLTAIFLKILQQISLQSSPSLYLTPDNIFILQFNSLSPSHIRICFGDSSTRRGSNNSLYQSPQLILNNEYSEFSLIWTLGVIFDELIHKTLFFPKMSAIVDQGCLKRVVGVMVVKEREGRVGMGELEEMVREEWEKAGGKEE